VAFKGCRAALIGPSFRTHKKNPPPQRRGGGWFRLKNYTLYLLKTPVLFLDKTSYQIFYPDHTKVNYFLISPPTQLANGITDLLTGSKESPFENRFIILFVN
jgi:hypothetical protein